MLERLSEVNVKNIFTVTLKEVTALTSRERKIQDLISKTWYLSFHIYFLNIYHDDVIACQSNAALLSNHVLQSIFTRCGSTDYVRWCRWRC